MGQSNSNMCAPRNTTSCPGPNNLPPLQFHQIHGDNIRISRDGTVAKRFESFCKGITFSSRPVRVNERVYIKFTEISNNWSGVIRFGFTYNDPATLRHSLPKYACPDLTNKPGFWAKALNERFCERDNDLFYYVTPAGDVHFGVNGEEKGVFITGVETRGPLWSIIDVYGNCTAIQFLDSRVYMFQQPQQQRRAEVVEVEVERLLPTLETLSIQNHDDTIATQTTTTSSSISSLASSATTTSIPAIRYASNSSRLVPVPFHRTKGRNIRLTPDKTIAIRADAEFCQGYVFTARPLKLGEKLIIQILRTEHMYVGALALGLTSCDPATLQPSDLPDDSDLLLDRPEYWVVSKDIASTPERGDEIMFCVTPNGEVQINKNGGPPSVVMHVDTSLQLWVFLDVYGSTQSVRVLSQSPVQTLPASSRRLQVQLPGSESMNSLNAQMESRKTAGRVINVPSVQSNLNGGDMIQIQPGGTVLVVNLPPAHADVLAAATAAAANQQIQHQQQSSRLHPQPQQQHQQSIQQTQLPTSQTLPSSSATMLSNYSNTYIEPISATSTNNYNNLATWQQQKLDAHNLNQTTSVECKICYEKPIDCVLYICGHMCMCYDCAIQQWRGIGDGHCPICRAVIHDVIRAYKP